MTIICPISGRLWSNLDAKILNVEQLRSRFCSIASIKSDLSLYAVLSNLFSGNSLNLRIALIMVDIAQYSIYGTFLTLILVSYLGKQTLRNRRNKAELASAIRSGLTEPTSLHPVINPNRCIGCGSCVSVCPEGNVLGLIDGKAELINPSHCIGHGACKAACPTDGITLVF